MTKIKITNVDIFQQIKSYGVDLDIDGRQITLSIQQVYDTNQDFTHIDNIEIEGKLKEGEEDKLRDWVENNMGLIEAKAKVI